MVFPPRPRTSDLKRRRQPGRVIPGNQPKKSTTMVLYEISKKNKKKETPKHRHSMRFKVFAKLLNYHGFYIFFQRDFSDFPLENFAEVG